MATTTIGGYDQNHARNDLVKKEDVEKLEDTSLDMLFVDDGISDLMVIYQNDLEALEDKARELARTIGVVQLGDPSRGEWAYVHWLEINVRNYQGELTLDWSPIQVAVVDKDHEPGDVRLSGPLMRPQFFDIRPMACESTSWGTDKAESPEKLILEPLYQFKAPDIFQYSPVFDNDGRVLRAHQDMTWHDPAPVLIGYDSSVFTDYDFDVNYWDSKSHMV